MIRIIGLLIALAALAAAAPAYAGPSAAADGTTYGGSGFRGARLASPSLGLLVRPDGRVTARAGFTITCGRKLSYVQLYARLSGTMRGTAFSASGHTRLSNRRSAQVRIQGTADGQTATGTARMSAPHCTAYTRSFVLHTESAPAGVAAVPAPGAKLTGLTVQSTGGMRLPMSIAITHNGKVTALWDVLMSCNPSTDTLQNLTPPTPIRPDGTFTRSESFNIRYTSGLVDHFRVKLTGAFRADGASGTLEASMRTTKPGSRYRPCASGAQTWAVRF
jgi:hypothetical protein